MPVKELLKSVNIWRKCGQMSHFYDPWRIVSEV